MLTMALHDAQEFNNHLGGRSNQDLALSAAFSIDNVVQAVILKQNGQSLKYKTKNLGVREQRFEPFWMARIFFEERATKRIT